MSLKQGTVTNRGPWLLTAAAIWVLILFLKSIEPPRTITAKQPVATVAAVAMTTTQALTATTPITAAGLNSTATTTVTASSIVSSTTAATIAGASLGGDAANGKILFASTCAACHGPNGEGVKGLGKDMTASPFIASLSDPDLLAFVKRGRDTGDPLNTTGVMMPPKGGNPTLDDAKLTDIIAFMRSIHKPTDAVAAVVITTTEMLTATVPSTTTGLAETANPTAMATSTISPTTPAPAADIVLTGAAANGKILFSTTCAACHGPNGEGVKGLGKDMTTSAFIASLSDPDLLAFIKRGRDTGDPLNTTGVMMPPKGGNPTLDDAKILDIIAFMRAIHKP